MVQKAADAVYEHLRQAIMLGQLAPDDRLRQGELADELGVSLIPVREAVTRLAADGLVVARPRLGARVAPVSVADARELFAMKRVLEPLALREAIPLALSADWAEAHRFVERMDGVDDPLRYAELNAQFHLALYQPCAMPRLLQTIKQVWAATFRYSAIWRRTGVGAQTSQAEHRAILAAAEAGNVDDACAHLEAHIGRAAARIIALAEASSDRRA
jgi:DNA-binding GntR family transcriptional regulator